VSGEVEGPRRTRVETETTALAPRLVEFDPPLPDAESPPRAHLHTALAATLDGAAVRKYGWHGVVLVHLEGEKGSPAQVD
jgi:hypothetical protein